MAVSFPEIEGKYEILEKLQVGGMGAIYKVRHRLLGDVRVVKTLRPQLVHDPSFQKRFHREARAATRLTHPNVARLYDFAIDESGAAYIVMEFIEGWPLEYLITRRELVPLGLVLEIAHQSLRAIGHLHTSGVIHRDISPDNLMLTRDVDGAATVKLIDLGLAKSVSASEELITASGMFVGKFRYAAPELFQRQDGSLAAPASDLYSFGLVLYELLTGRFPIQGKSAQSLMAGHLYHPPLPFDESDPENRVPDDLRRVVSRALAKSPEERFATAEDFVAALQPIRCRYDADTPEIRQLLELIREPPRRSESQAKHSRSDSTQNRLDRHFTGPTPAPEEPPITAAARPPSAETSATLASLPLADRIELHVAEGDFGAARQELARAAETEGESDVLRELGERIAETERIARTREVEEGIDEVEALRAQGELRQALELARRLHEVSPEHKLARLVIHELETALDEDGSPPEEDDSADADTDVFDEVSILTTTPFDVTYPAPTEAFDEAALAQTDILPQASDDTTRPIAEGDLRAQLRSRTVATPVSHELTRAESQPTTPLPIEPRTSEPPPVEPPPVEPPPVEPQQVSASPSPAAEPSFFDLPLGDAGSSPSGSPPPAEERWGYDLLDSAAPSPQPPASQPPPASEPQQRAFDEISLQTIPQQRRPAAQSGAPLEVSSAPEADGPATPELYLASSDDDGAAVDDLTLRIGEGGEVIAPADQEPGDLPAAGTSNQRLWLTAAILIVAALLIGLGLSSLTGGGAGETLEEEDVDAAQLSTGTLVVEPRQPVDVVRILDQAGRERPLPSPARTPLTLELKAGSYTLTVLDPSTGQRLEMEAVVIVGEERRVSRIIVP